MGYIDCNYRSMTNAFKHWRTSRKLGQGGAGKACGVDRVTWWRWENDVSKVAIDKLDEVERVTGIPRHVLRPDIFVPAPQQENAA